MTEGMDYYCKETCFHANKRFKVGDLFPPNWIAGGIKPNNHFAPMTPDQAKQIMKMQQEELKKKAPQSAGEDRRSTTELKQALFKHVKAIPENWTRKQIWAKLFEAEHNVARSNQDK